MVFFWIIGRRLVVWLITGVRIINQYERGVVLRLGKIRPSVKEPGLRLIIPIVDQIKNQYTNCYPAGRQPASYNQR
jgi:regulator of protease activity HflC (stomatin/prohibitin superfamily)